MALLLSELKLISASNIIRLRTQAGLTQAELGEKLNYSDKTISKWERGEAIPDAYVLTQMAEIFGVTVDYLLSTHDAWENPNQQEEQEQGMSRHSVNMIIAIAVLGVWTMALSVFVLLWLPVIGIQLVSAQPHQQLLMSHYSSALLAVTPVVALYGMRSLRAMSRKRRQLRRLKQPALAAAVVLMLGCHVVCCDLPLSRYVQYTVDKLPPYQGGVLSLPLRPVYWEEMLNRLLHADGARALFEQLPLTPESTVVCQNEPGVWFLPKARVFDFPVIGFGTPPVFRADFFVLDRNNYSGRKETFYELPPVLNSLLPEEEYGVIDDPGGVLIFYRRAIGTQPAAR